MKIGGLELLVIFVVVLLVIGPDRLPLYARKFGNAMREFRKASADVTQEIRESVIDPPEEAQAPLREALEPLEDLDRSLKAEVKSMEDDLNNLGKSKPSKASAPEKSGEPAPQPSAPEEKSEPAPQTPVPEGGSENEGNKER